MRCARALALVAAGFLAFAPAAFADEDLSIQTFSAGSAACEDRRPDIAASSGGSFLLVWSRYCEDAPGIRLTTRLYDADARPIGPEVDLGEGVEFSLAALPDGTFAIAWVRPFAPFRAEIFLQKLDARGRRISTPLSANPDDPSYSQVPRLAVDRTGRLALLWQRTYSQPYRAELVLRRFAADLTPDSEILAFADRPPYRPERPDLAFAESGDLLVAWGQYVSEPPAAPYTAIFGRLFPSDGSEAGPSFRITSLGMGPQTSPRLLGAPRFGGWQMAWQGNSSGKIDARFAYLPKDTVQLGQISGLSVDPSREGYAEAAPAADARGGVLVLSETTDGPIARRQFDPLGLPVGGPSEVAPFGVWDAEGPALSRSVTGSFLAVWAAASRVEFDLDVVLPRGWDLHGRIFRRDCPVTGGNAACLFSDRFGVQVVRGAGASTVFARPTVLDDGSVLFAFPGKIPEVAVRMTQEDGEVELTYAATTNSALSIQVTDRLTGHVAMATKPAGRFASGRIERLGTLAPASDSPLAAPRDAAASAAAPPLELSGGRFKIEVTRPGADGAVQRANGALFDDRRGVYRFGNDLSLTVALVDGRATNGKFWVYLGDLSDHSYRVKITDIATGKAKVYRKAAGRLFTRVDRQAF